jgi:hypothetical protein
MDELFGVVRPKSTKQAVAEVVGALMQLVLVLGIDEDVHNLAINYNGRYRRLDIARMDEAGQTLEAWLTGLNADVERPAHVGEVVSLPSSSGTVQ